MKATYPETQGTSFLQVFFYPAYGETAIKVDFVEQPGKTKFGFDPPNKSYFGPLPPAETDDDGGSEAWASVCIDATRDVVRLSIEPASIADQIELVVAQGDTHLDITPKTFASGVTDLQLIGKSTPGLAVVEARIIGSGEVCSKLNARVLEPPSSPVSFGVYRIIDSQSPGTQPVNAPSDSEILDVVNSVYEQSCISFVLATNSGTYDIHYDIHLPYVTSSNPPPGYYPFGSDGKYQFGEWDQIYPPGVDPSTLPWSEAAHPFFLFRQNGDLENGGSYDDPYTNIAARGFSSGEVFTETGEAAPQIALAIAHELGHRLGLATKTGQYDYHDPGPWPQGYESLMRSGTPLGPPSNPSFPVPGEWLRQEDWLESNTKAKE